MMSLQRSPFPTQEWIEEMIKDTMEQTGISREEAEESLEFDLMFGGCLMQEYVAKLKAHQNETKVPRASR